MGFSCWLSLLPRTGSWRRSSGQVKEEVSSSFSPDKWVSLFLVRDTTNEDEEFASLEALQWPQTDKSRDRLLTDVGAVRLVARKREKSDQKHWM